MTSWAREHSRLAHRPGGARGVLDQAMSEKDLLSAVEQLAVACGWLSYHTRDSRRSAGGFPDLVLAHPAGMVIFAELKRAGGRGRVSAEQAQWLGVLGAAASSSVVVRVWRPGDWPEIERILTTRSV
ncbi:MAG: VRR-NUC domain-containing protein [Dehalococcoidia bacterium]